MVLHEFAIQPMQQLAYTKGRNATDTAMIIDAMDLLYTKQLDGFGIVSSDSDFTPLVMRIRANGLRVFCFGEQKTPLPFVNACSKFLYLETLRRPEEASIPPLMEAIATTPSVPPSADTGTPKPPATRATTGTPNSVGCFRQSACSTCAPTARACRYGTNARRASDVRTRHATRTTRNRSHWCASGQRSGTHRRDHPLRACNRLRCLPDLWADPGGNCID